ncbi:Gfo/Idh/MocA family oxidoreductase [soil metagenome]
MAQPLRVGIIGAGWPGTAHAKGYSGAGGYKVAAVADLIPARRKQLMQSSGATCEYSDAKELIADKEIDVVSICLPNHLHLSTTLAALKSGKHVCCEKPPTLDAGEAKKIESAATKSGRVVIYGFQLRFGGAELAAKAAIDKGYAGEIYHARASWMRTRGVPQGTGWYTDKSKSGGGAMIDLGSHMLDLAWHLLGQLKPKSVFAISHSRFVKEIDDLASALITFDGGKTLELATSWAINQQPQQQGMLCRLHGDKAAVDVYTSSGAVIHRSFDDKGSSKPTTLTPPKVVGHAALMRHFKQCITGDTKPQIGPAEGVVLMQMIDAIYKSAGGGKSVEMK